MTTNEKDYSYKEHYKEFLLLIVAHLMKKIEVDALIVGNFNYWEHREWTNAFNEFQISTFCYIEKATLGNRKKLHGENIYSDAQQSNSKNGDMCFWKPIKRVV